MATGLRAVEGTFSHRALFYRDEAGYVSSTVRFVLDGLAAGEVVAVAVPARWLRRLEDALGPAAAQVALIDIQESGRNPARIIPEFHAFLDEHAPGPVRVVGEPVWPGRSEEEYPACVQHEAMVNLTFAHRRVTFLCPYDVGALGPEVVRDAETTHPLLAEADTDRVRPSPRYSPELAYDRYNEPLSAPPEAFVVPFDVETLSKARRVAAEFAARAGIAEDRLADVMLAVGEICANSVQHGGCRGELAVWTTDDGVVCQVTDRGRFTERLAGCVPVSPYQQGGRGLLLVNKVADLVRTYTAPDGLTTHIHVCR